MRFLPRADIRRLMEFEDYVSAVEGAFLSQGNAGTLPARVLHLPTMDGGFHVKAAGLARDGAFVAVKINGNFPANGARFGLPTIQGVLFLADAQRGTPLALLDSAEITVQRTGAATALAAALGARAEACVAAICGCGLQGRVQLRALARGRALERILAWDIDSAAAERFAGDVSAEFGIEVVVAGSPREAVRDADLIATCTPSRRAYLRAQDVRPGAFVAAVGADSEGKQELEPELLARARVMVDSAAQAAAMGDSQHAIAAGMLAHHDFVGELGDLLSGAVQARLSESDVVVFDSTGTALQDVAAAVAVFRRAEQRGVGAELWLT